jgi:hypothetical protein
MDQMAGMDATDREIEETMRELGLERAEADVMVGLRRGQLLGDGDLLSVCRLTSDQQRRLGLGRSIDDVLIEQRRQQDR